MLDFASRQWESWSLWSRRGKEHLKCNKASTPWINCNSDHFHEGVTGNGDGQMWKICEKVTPLLMMQHLPQRNLHTRESQVAFLCGVYYMITLKREISLDFGLSYWTHGLVDAYPKYFSPWNHHMWLSKHLENYCCFSVVRMTYIGMALFHCLFLVIKLL